MKKRFWTFGPLFWVSVIFLALPYLLALWFVQVGDWWAFIIAPPASYLLYATIFHRFIRLIAFKGNAVYATPSLTPIDPIQHRIMIDLKETVAADFLFVQGDSNGKKIYHAWDIPCLAFRTKDGELRRIILLGFSRNQLMKIEAYLLTICPELPMERRASSLWKKD